MDPVTIALAISAVESLIRLITQAIQAGQLTPEQQQYYFGRIDSIRSQLAFSGPEWQKSTGPSTPVVTTPSDGLQFDS